MVCRKKDSDGFFDRVVDEIDAHKIVVDDYGEGFRATQQLISQGAKTIAHIGGPLNLKIYENRQKEYCDALKVAGIEVDETLIITNNLSREEGTAAIKKLLKNRVKPSNTINYSSDLARKVKSGLSNLCNAYRIDYQGIIAERIIKKA